MSGCVQVSRGAAAPYNDDLLRLALILCVVVGCTTTPTPTTSAEPPLPPGYLVTVQAGQTVWQLAEAAGLSVDEVIEVNGLESADQLAAGQILFIPAAAGSSSSSSSSSSSQDTSSALADMPVAASTAASLLWPVEGIVLRDFSVAEHRAGRAAKGGYDGVLIAAPGGTVVRAAAAGVVAFVGTQETTTGLFVVVDHPGELVTVYAHLQSTSVRAGAKVDVGEAIGVIGASGLVGVSPRLQFQVRRRKAPVDPLTLLPP